MTFPIVREPARTPSAGPTPGAKALMAWTIEHFDATNLGIYNNRSVRGGVALSLHAEGRAGDSGYPYTVGGTEAGWRLANWLIEHHAALGVQQVIYSRRIWANTRANEGWRYYSGTAAHYEHVHWELTRQASRELTTEMIAAAVNPPPTEADAMTPEAIISYVNTAYGPDSDDRRGKLYWIDTAIDLLLAGEPDEALQALRDMRDALGLNVA